MKINPAMLTYTKTAKSAKDSKPDTATNLNFKASIDSENEILKKQIEDQNTKIKELKGKIYTLEHTISTYKQIYEPKEAIVNENIMLGKSDRMIINR